MVQDFEVLGSTHLFAAALSGHNAGLISRDAIFNLTHLLVGRSGLEDIDYEIILYEADIDQIPLHPMILMVNKLLK